MAHDAALAASVQQVEVPGTAFQHRHASQHVAFRHMLTHICLPHFIKKRFYYFLTIAN
jgi:hypothetical protein